MPHLNAIVRLNTPACHDLPGHRVKYSSALFSRGNIFIFYGPYENECKSGGGLKSIYQYTGVCFPLSSVINIRYGNIFLRIPRDLLSSSFFLPPLIHISHSFFLPPLSRLPSSHPRTICRSLRILRSASSGTRELATLNQLLWSSGDIKIRNGIMLSVWGSTLTYRTHGMKGAAVRSAATATLSTIQNKPPLVSRSEVFLFFPHNAFLAHTSSRRKVCPHECFMSARIIAAKNTVCSIKSLRGNEASTRRHLAGLLAEVTFVFM